jgi:hypothetical protein
MRHVTGMLAVAMTAAALAQETRPPAFDPRPLEPIFDGTSLAGWVTKGGRYDGNALWSVEDGAICGREGPGHAGGLLYTGRTYACFLLSLEVWMTRPNDSGIFVRMAPEGRGAQVTLDDRDDGEVGAVYSDGFLAHNATARGRWRPSQWNLVQVRCTGRDLRVEAWLNGEKISDHQIPPGTPGFAPTGRIGLQVHGDRDDPPGTVVKFRDVRIRELPIVDNADFVCDDHGSLKPTPAGAARGWTALFDPASPGSWEIEGPKDGFLMASGVLALRGGGPGSIRTTEDFQDFELHLDFTLGHMANSGIFLRAARDGSNPAFSGCEIQILDDDDWEHVTQSKLEPWQFTGSIYGSSPPRVRGVPRAAPRSNSMRIVYQGTRLLVELNGVTLQDADVSALTGGRPFAERAKTGFIGIQRHGHERSAPTYLEIRNAFVRRLP